jgi:hypothetical protein
MRGSENLAEDPLWEMIVRGSKLPEGLKKSLLFLLLYEKKMLPSGLRANTSVPPGGTESPYFSFLAWA